MGEPNRVNTLLLSDEFIVSQSETQGTETSQYLQEEKSNEILRVAASEMGIAQTVAFSDAAGLQGLQSPVEPIEEWSGKSNETG